jgi:demethylmenaquinone methyltransferase/2-methoxy-6-polyprenyl-1,4-benzoquinol methylase
VNDVLAEQRRYYAARAPEYDDWWYRRGPYALDEETLAGWNADIAEIEGALDARGTVLDLAAGTGIWTSKLARTADRVVAVDANPEPLALNRAPAEHVVADIFEWEPPEPFDFCFFGFWLSHVPDDRFDDFWALVRRAVRPGGRVFLVDNGVGDPAHTRPVPVGDREIRRLADGREFEIVKLYRSPAEIAERVQAFDLDLRITANGHFVYGGGA